MKQIAGAASLLLGLIGQPGASAQEEQVSGIQVLSVGSLDGQDADQFRQSIGNGASFSFASPMANISVGGIGGVNPNDRSQLFGLLSNESVRAELSLSAEQTEAVSMIQKEAGERLREAMTQVMASGAGVLQLKGADFQEKITENRRTAEAAIEEILLPAQLKRVRQMAYQVEVAQVGLGEALTNGRLGKEIGVYDEQKEQLLQRAAKIEAEAQAAILKIKAAAQARMFAELAPDQRKAAEDLLGDYFEYKEPNLGQELRKKMQQVRNESESSDDSETRPARRRSRN